MEADEVVCRVLTARGELAEGVGVALHGVDPRGGVGLGGAPTQRGQGVRAGVDDGDVVAGTGERDGGASGSATEVQDTQGAAEPVLRRVAKASRAPWTAAVRSPDGFPPDGIGPARRPRLVSSLTSVSHGRRLRPSPERPEAAGRWRAPELARGQRRRPARPGPSGGPTPVGGCRRRATGETPRRARAPGDRCAASRSVAAVWRPRRAATASASPEAIVAADPLEATELPGVPEPGETPRRRWPGCETPRSPVRRSTPRTRSSQEWKTTSGVGALDVLEEGAVGRAGGVVEGEEDHSTPRTHRRGLGGDLDPGDPHLAAAAGAEQVGAAGDPQRSQQRGVERRRRARTRRARARRARRAPARGRSSRAARRRRPSRGRSPRSRVSWVGCSAAGTTSRAACDWAAACSRTSSVGRVLHGARPRAAGRCSARRAAGCGAAGAPVAAVPPLELGDVEQQVAPGDPATPPEPGPAAPIPCRESNAAGEDEPLGDRAARPGPGSRSRRGRRTAGRRRPGRPPRR